jgi:hypothetical protein
MMSDQSNSVPLLDCGFSSLFFSNLFLPGQTAAAGPSAAVSHALLLLPTHVLLLLPIWTLV